MILPNVFFQRLETTSQIMTVMVVKVVTVITVFKSIYYDVIFFLITYCCVI